MPKSNHQTIVVIPNLNGGAAVLTAIQSLTNQTLVPHIVVVDNASIDNSVKSIRNKYPEVEIIQNASNLGFAGGVNVGIRRAIEMHAEFVTLFNDDAVADKSWLEKLVSGLAKTHHIGIATSKILNASGNTLDSTGEFYSNWGLPYPRGRGEATSDKYDRQTEIFAASGGASLYRVKMLAEIGLFDEDFFAYYEDVDISFRAQLAGWKVAYTPNAIVYHQIGATSGKMKGFTTYQTLKNLPLVWYKNIPRKYLWRIGWRLALAQSLFFARAISRGNTWPAIKGAFVAWILLFKKVPERRKIQTNKKVSDEYIWKFLVRDLPPNASALRQLRSYWWKITRRPL